MDTQVWVSSKCRLLLQTQIVLAIISDRDLSSRLVGQQKARPPTNQNLLFYSLLVEVEIHQLSPSNTLVVEQSRSAELLEKHTSDVDTRDLDLYLHSAVSQKHLVQIPQKMQFFIPFLVLQNQLLLPEHSKVLELSTFLVLQENANSIITMDLEYSKSLVSLRQKNLMHQQQRLDLVPCSQSLVLQNPSLQTQTRTQFYTILLELRNQLSELKRSKVLEQLQFLVNLVSRSFFTSMVLVESLSVELLENPLHQLTEIGSGSITLSGTKGESFTKGNYTGSGSITLSGAAVETKLDHYTGSGTATLSGAAALKIIIIITGSGSLFAVGGAAESKTTNKPESTILFAVSGAATESFGKGNYDGSGTKTFFGAGIEKQTDDYVGTGSASISGAADTDRTRSFVGSGSLFAIGGAAEAVAVVGSVLDCLLSLVLLQNLQPKEITTDLEQSPSVVQRQNLSSKHHMLVLERLPSVVSSPISNLLTVIKDSQVSRSVVLQKEAERETLLDLVPSSQLAEQQRAPPRIYQNLLVSSRSLEQENRKTTVREISGGGVITITGQATNVRFNRGWTGSGLITLTGNTIEKATTDYVGSGSLFAIGGGAESKTTNPPEDIVLYRFTGTAGDQKLTFREVFSGTITLSGSAGARFVINNIGSGTTTLSGIGAESKGADLIGVSSPGYIFFSAFGGTKYARTFPGQTEGGTITLSGRADTQELRNTLVLVLSSQLAAVETKTTNIPENTVLFVATGAAATPRTRDFFGSGSINLSGDASITRTFGYAGSGTITLSGTADTDRTRAFWNWISLRGWWSSRSEDKQQTRKHRTVRIYWRHQDSKSKSVCRFWFSIRNWWYSRSSCSCSRNDRTLQNFWRCRSQVYRSLQCFWSDYHQRQRCRSIRQTKLRRVWIFWWILWIGRRKCICCRRILWNSDNFWNCRTNYCIQSIQRNRISICSWWSSRKQDHQQTRKHSSLQLCWRSKRQLHRRWVSSVGYDHNIWRCSYRTQNIPLRVYVRHDHIKTSAL